MAYGNGFPATTNFGTGAAPRNTTNPRGNNSQPQKQQLSTGGPTVYNNQAGKFLTFNYWGKNASLEIGTVGPGATMDWQTRKNAQTFRLVIGFNDLSDLQDVCEEVMDSIKTTGTFTSTAIKCGLRQDSVVEINNGSTIGMSPGIYLALYKNLDSNGRTGNLDVYPFGSVKVLRGYNYQTGAAKEDISKLGEFKKFYKMVKEATKAFTMAQAHAVAVIHDGEKLATFKALSAIMGAMGIDVNAELKQTTSFRPKSNTTTGSRSGAFEKTNAAPPAAYQGASPATANTSPFGGTTTMAQQYLASMDEPVDITMDMDGLTNVDVSKFT